MRRLNLMLRAIPLVAVLSVTGQNAKACQCGTVPDALGATKTAVIVFTGVVTKTHKVAVIVTLDGKEQKVKATNVYFRVDRVWKGAVKRETVVSSNVSDCDYRFEVGKEYLVYAEDSTWRPSPWASKCLRTRLLADAREDVSTLGAAKEPEECEQK